MMRAFSNIAIAVKAQEFKGDPEMTKMITKFMPRMLEISSGELYRCLIGDVLTLVEGYAQLWSNEVLPIEQLMLVHQQCEIYLDNYLEKTKRNMNGT